MEALRAMAVVKDESTTSIPTTVTALEISTLGHCGSARTTISLKIVQELIHRQLIYTYT